MKNNIIPQKCTPYHKPTKKKKIKFAQPRKNPNPIPELPPRKIKNIAQIIKQIRKRLQTLANRIRRIIGFYGS